MIRSGLRPWVSSSLSTPTWAKPRAPPPPSTSATLGGGGRGGGVSMIGAGGFETQAAQSTTRRQRTTRRDVLGLMAAQFYEKPAVGGQADGDGVALYLQYPPLFHT